MESSIDNLTRKSYLIKWRRILIRNCETEIFFGNFTVVKYSNKLSLYLLYNCCVEDIGSIPCSCSYGTMASRLV